MTLRQNGTFGGPKMTPFQTTFVKFRPESLREVSKGGPKMGSRVANTSGGSKIDPRPMQEVQKGSFLEGHF